MLIVLSPAKTLDYTSATPDIEVTRPRFVKEAAVLVDILRAMSPADLSRLMSISDKLAVLNADRYAAWSTRFTAANSRPAALAFAGDVYEGLDAPSLAPADLLWAQDSVAMLSGLYGVLRPLDLMQAYRLEMGTKLRNPAGADLYAYWRGTVANALRAQLRGHAHPVLVNLASDEYFGAVDVAALGHPVVQPVFQEGNGEEGDGGSYRIVSFHAKRARGLMTRYAVQHRIEDPEALKDFAAEGYAFAPQASTASRWVFRRAKPKKTVL